MKKETLLHIAEPCHENWNSMTAGQQGRFCGSCCKTVVDFSAMSDQEILQMLSKAAGKTCGRFTQEQLQRPLAEEKMAMSKPKKLFLSALIPTFLLANTAIAQTNKLTEKKPRQTTEKVIDKDGSSVKIPTTNTIEERPAIMGMVAVKCDVNDSVSIVKADAFNKHEDKMQEELNNADLDKTAVMMGGIEAYSKVTFTDTIKTIVRKTFDQNAFKVYANPATQGGSINIQFKNGGTYTVQLLDASGRMYLSKLIVAGSDKQQVLIKLPSNALAGHYYIRAIDEKKKKEYVDKMVIK